MPISVVSHGFQPYHGCFNASCIIPDDLLPDQKDVRAEMLKTRFADTIKKANSFLNGGFTTDSKEKERRARLQPRKKTKIEAENQLKLAKRREAARMALKEMEKRVVVEDNFKVMKELDILLGRESRKIFKVIGLHLKKEEEFEEGAEE